MKILILSIISSILYFKTTAQVTPDKNRLIVLHQNKIGKSFSFEGSSKDGYDSTVIIYLGKLKTKDGRFFKILTSRWYWGLSPRATSRIVIFNNKNQYIGNYNVTTTSDLPNRIKKNNLVFDNKNNGDCDTSLLTRISFWNGIPKRFFVECKNGFGDIWSFESEE